MDDHKRLDELRRRVEKDPASIAFAALAEELRKAGEYHEAVRVCREGLAHHPTYLSARVTLGRALLELQQYPEARTELEYVLQAAPDNLLALKCMTELQERAPAELMSEAPPEPASAASLSFAVPAASLAFAAPTSSLSFAAPPLPPEPASEATAEPSAPAADPALAELEGWEARIQADRAQRAGRSQ